MLLKLFYELLILECSGKYYWHPQQLVLLHVIFAQSMCSCHQRVHMKVLNAFQASQYSNSGQAVTSSCTFSLFDCKSHSRGPRISLDIEIQENRRAGNSLNMIGTNLIGGHNLPTLVEIGLMYLPKIVGTNPHVHICSRIP